MHVSRRTLFALAIVASIGLGLMPTRAYATAVVIPDQGILTIENFTGELVGFTSSPNGCIDFAGLGTCGTTPVNMDVSGTSSIFTVGSGTIGDILNGVSETTPFETVTGKGSEAGNTINFNLDSLVTNTGGTIGNCTSDTAFNSCTPAGSPFTFSMDSSGTQLTISFTALLSAYTGPSATGTTPYRAIFSTTYSGDFDGSGACEGIAANITDALTCEAAGGTIASTWSASESPISMAATPEPAGRWYIVAGLIALAVFNRRLRQSQSQADQR